MVEPVFRLFLNILKFWNKIIASIILKIRLYIYAICILNILELNVIHGLSYTKLTCGMARFHFTYLWFKTLHFAHLRLVSLAFRNPPLHLPLEKHIFRQKQI